MAGELNNEINQLKIKISNDNDRLERLRRFLHMAELINEGTVTPELVQVLRSLYQEINK